jgi:outer membrane protein, heavy metal efflux system
MAGNDRKPAFHVHWSSVAAIVFAGSLLAQEPVQERQPLDLREAVALAITQSPRLGKAAFGVDVARGKAYQSSLHPNPTVSISGDELGDRTGAQGIWTAPKIEQEIVTGRKRSLNMAAADRDVAKAELAVATEWLTLRSDVEGRYLDAVAAVRRIELLSTAVSAGETSAEQVRRREAAKEASRLEVVLIESQLEKYRAELSATRQEADSALQRLALMIGWPNLQGRPLAFDWDAPIPDIDASSIQLLVVENHPSVAAARVELQRAQTLLERARAEPIPNVTLSTGYTRQNQNRSHDWLFGISAPLPAWDRNQGNIKAAKAAVGEAAQEIARTQVELADAANAALRAFASAKAKAVHYRQVVLPKAQEVYDLTGKAYQAGQLDFDKLFESQRVIIDARLESLKSTTEAWKAALLLMSMSSRP